jgi:cardiolipin synthase (CMP-forming)
VGDPKIHTERAPNRRSQDSPKDSQDAGVIKTHLPNAMTLTRALLAAAFPFLPRELRLAALVVAALTEWLDGTLSRLWRVESDFGRMLDPVADKLFVLAMLGTFVWEGWLSLPAAGLVILRDLTVAVACVWILVFGDRDELARLRPRAIGKIATAAQFVFLLLVLLWQEAPVWLIALTATLSAAAAMDYIAYYFRDVHPASSAQETIS